ncbi:glycosyl hydrolase family 28-related protein [Priestia sp. SB1]|uniref:glycosyl hydrolase family 28-related protein n=1 Tax=Priestia sp. SB1 TaxID=3132359 RepID=UPI003179D5D0
MSIDAKITNQELADSLKNQINEVNNVKTDLEMMKENIDSALLINQATDENSRKIGDLNSLNTDSKQDLVNALNSTETKVKNLSQLPNEFEWTASEGQLEYTLPNGTSYDPNVKWLRIEIGGASIPPSKVNKVSSTKFSLLLSPSDILEGIKVVARWSQPMVTGNIENGVGTAHHTSHELGGTDEIDITKLRGYSTSVLGKIGDVSTLQTSSKTNIVGSINELVNKSTINSSEIANVSNKIGNLGSLETEAQSTVVDAVNAINKKLLDSPSKIGELGGLLTSDKSTVVKAINENVAKIDTLQNKSITYVTPEMFGAKGDGVNDDTSALQSAINSLEGVTTQLKLSSGSTYKISSTLTIDKSISIMGNKQNRPRITTGSQTFDAINVQGSYVASTTMSSSATINTDYIDVADSSNIRKSNLIEIVSSKSWYHDPRQESTDARKAELHRVNEVIGNRIYLTDPLFDGYVVPDETVDINIYTPIRFAMSDVDIILTKYPYSTDSVRKIGLILDHTIDALIENVNVVDAQNMGINIKHSYRPIVEGGRTEGANNYFSGYGVQIVGCTHARVYNRFVATSRRGVDVSGYTIPSHSTIVDGCTVFGGGSNSMGDKYVYTDTHGTGAYAGGIGTHGAADHTIIRNCIFGYLHTAIIDRSRNTLADGNYFIGDFAKACIDVSFGENGTYVNNRAVDNYSGLKEKTVSDNGANINTRRPPLFIRFQDTALVNGSSGGFVVVENNFAMIQDRFIEFYGETGGSTIPTLKNFTVRNNNVMFSPYGTTDVAYFLKNSTVANSSILMSGSIIKGNTWKRTSGSGSVYQFGNVDPRTATEVDSPRTYAFYLTTDTVSSVNIGSSNMSYARIMVDAGGSTGVAYGLVRVTQGYTTTNEVGTLNNISCIDIVPTGTTGTSGKINLALKDGILYVENRIGSTQRILLTVFAAI